VVRGRRCSCRRQADGRAGPNVGRTAGPAPGLVERIRCPELANVQAMPLQNQHSTPEERAASRTTGDAQPLAIVTTKARRWQFDFVVVCNIIAVSVEYDTIAVLVTDMAC